MTPVKAMPRNEKKAPVPKKGKDHYGKILGKALRVQGEMLTYRCRGAAADLFRCKDPEVMIEGPAGCVAPDTILQGAEMRIEELCRRNIRPVVETSMGKVKASVPFLKGIAPIYKIRTKNLGASVIATEDHLIMIDGGWRNVSQLKTGMKIPVMAHPVQVVEDDLVVHLDTVESIESVGKSPYYDLHVPGAEHYFAGGLIHHNTGKTRAVLEKCFQLAEEYPGCRMVFCRQTRVSMTESVLVTWERFVVPRGHACLVGPGRGNRKFYEFPNGSIIVVSGLENAESEDGHPIMSAEFDIACIFEALEVSQNDYEKVLTRLRLGVIPFQMLVADCNPGPPGHWLNRRQGMTRLRSRHRDNPLLWDKKDKGWTQAGQMYMRNLSRLTGVRRRRLLDGLWSAAEGQVFEDWDPLVHCVDRKKGMVGLKWYFGVKDWGYTNPGVTQIWGVDGDGRMVMVHELYRTRQIIDWWIREDQKLQAHFKCRSWVADPAEPEYMERYRRSGFPIRGAMNAIPLGVQAVQERLALDPTGKPRMVFLNDALKGKDEDLDSKREPCCTTDEFENYTWSTPKKDDRALDEEPVDKYNHGMDCCRYAALFVNRRAGSAESAYTNVGVGADKKKAKAHNRGWTGMEGGVAYRARQSG